MKFYGTCHNTNYFAAHSITLNSLCEIDAQRAALLGGGRWPVSWPGRPMREGGMLLTLEIVGLLLASAGALYGIWTQDGRSNTVAIASTVLTLAALVAVATLAVVKSRMEDREGRVAEQRREDSLLAAFAGAELVQEIRDATNGNFALGGERFKRQVEMMLGRRVSRGQRGRPRKTEKPSKPTAVLFE